MLDAAKVNYKITNVWTDASAGTTSTELKSTLLPHDVLMIRLKK